VSQAEIDWLYLSRRIPEEVFCWIPGMEREPVPNPGEVVVFIVHFERGFGLPALPRLLRASAPSSPRQHRFLSFFICLFHGRFRRPPAYCRDLRSLL
jgi:hypothetical protein